ncbi:mitochondrial inner membrane protein-domain-containing protein [Chlamydoabsidia padenii]|nr:mitochondrial inner membrane protein-domain-containing protein [Chlamydoabsidia padenii]
MLRGTAILSNATRLSIRSVRSPLMKRSYTSEQSTKGTSSIGKKILWTTLLGAGSFGGVTLYALHDEGFGGIYTQYVPEGTRILTAASHISTHVGLLEEAALDWYDYLGDALAYLKGDKEPAYLPSSTYESKRRTTTKELLPPLFDHIIHEQNAAPVPTIITNSAEPLVDDLVKTTQQLIESLNKVGLGGYAKRLGDLATRGIQTIDQEFKAVQEGNDFINAKLSDLTQQAEKVDNKVSKHHTTLMAKVAAAQDESKRQLIDHVVALERRLVAETHKVQQQLAEMGQMELNSQREQAMMALQNDLKAQVAELQQAFTKQVQDQVERNGRLVNIDKVVASQSQLEQLVVNNVDHLDKSRASLGFLVAIDALKRAALAGNTQSFLQELHTLRASTDDSLVQVVVASISETVAHHGISSLSQLVDRYKHVAAQVREASLIPEQGSSMISHVISIVLSKLLFTKQGLVPGDDIEARLARAEYYLARQDDLESAAREINQLKGWPKHLANDWLEAARRHLEIKQALDIMRSQAVLNSLLELD